MRSSDHRMRTDSRIGAADNHWASSTRSSSCCPRSPRKRALSNCAPPSMWSRGAFACFCRFVCRWPEDEVHRSIPTLVDRSRQGTCASFDDPLTRLRACVRACMHAWTFVDTIGCRNHICYRNHFGTGCTAPRLAERSALCDGSRRFRGAIHRS